MTNILERIKNNIGLLNNENRSKAYSDVLNETLGGNNLSSEDSLKNLVNSMSKNVNYIGEHSPIDKLVAGMHAYREGFNENFHNPFNPNNLRRVEGKTFGTRLGEAIGTAGRFLDSPLGRFALMGGITALNGGSGLDVLNYGLGAGVLNQQLRNQDSMYRTELMKSGVPSEMLDNVKGYISPETYNNFVKGQYMHDNTDIDRDYKEGMLDVSRQNAETDKNYKEGMLDVSQQNAETSRQKNEIDLKKNFVQAKEYYKALVQQGFITDEQYKQITEAPDFDPYELINLNLENVVVDKQNAVSKAKKTADDIKTNSQKRYFLNKNDGKQVMKVEYGPKPVQKTHMVVDHNYNYGNGDSTKNPKYKGNGGQKSSYGEAHDKFLPKNKKTVVF